MSDLNCPYCGIEIDIRHDDGFGYEENELHEYECPECEKNFIFEAVLSWDFFPLKADCLNDGNHIYQPTKTYPIEFTRLRCTICGHEKPLEKEGVQS